MKFFRLDLLTLLISLFILNSCKNDNTISLPTGEEQLNGTLVVDDNIVVNTVAEDPINTSGILKTPLSSFNDNVFGETTSNIAAGIDLPGHTSYTLPTGTITTDSAVLELRYIDGFYGDSLTSKYKVNVYKLTEMPIVGQSYLSNKSWGSASTLTQVGGTPQAFNARPKTPVKVNHILTGKTDSLHFVAPHIRVPIQTSFINSVFFGAPSAQLTTPTTFQNAIKGLYITLQRNQPSEAGGNIMLNVDSCRIHVYYRAVNNGTIDTAEAVLPVTTGSVSGITIGAHAAEIKHTYTTTITEALNNTTQSSSEFYLQGGGLRAKVSFPDLDKLFGTANVNQVALNRAELVITPKENSGVPYAPLPQLTMYRLDIAKQRQLVPDANGSSQAVYDPYYFSNAVFGGRYDATKQQYRFIITGYIQKLLNKTLTDYGTYIAPVDTSQVSLTSATSMPIAGSAQTAARTIAVGSNKSSPYKIKLNVIYTNPNP